MSETSGGAVNCSRCSWIHSVLCFFNAVCLVSYISKCKQLLRLLAFSITELRFCLQVRRLQARHATGSNWTSISVTKASRTFCTSTMKRRKRRRKRERKWSSRAGRSR